VHEYNERFTKLLSGIKRRHDPVVTTIAQGILEYKREAQTPRIDRSIQTFLDRFYMSRIGIRVLIGQHIALNRLEPHEDYVGIICTKTNVHQIAREAIENASYVCEEHFGLFKGPPVQLVCRKDIDFMYVPSHLVSLLTSPFVPALARTRHCPLTLVPPRTTSCLRSSRTRSELWSRRTELTAKTTRRSR